jgi:hypothetical protein
MSMGLTRILFLLLLCIAVSATARTRSPQSENIFSDEAVAKESKALSRLKRPERLKLRRALELLQQAHSTASVSTDFEEIAAISRRADAAVDAAVGVAPDGVLKGALVSCKKALGHSFILRLVNKGELDPSKPPTSEAMEDITLRYQLAGVPEYERPARVLDFARAHLLIADRICSRAGIVKTGR